MSLLLLFNGAALSVPQVDFQQSDTFSAAGVAVSVTNARISRESIEALSQITPDARISRESVEALSQVTPDARISRLNMEVLISEASFSVEFWGAVSI